ncbi:MAG: YlxM family DNA-binding protein [Christensenellales bacterium]
MKNLEIALLLDFYEGLLTPKQRNLLDLYYNNDYSLSEIAQLEGVSRQAVLDNLKRGEALLADFEQKLHLSEKYNKTVQAARRGMESYPSGSKEASLFTEILDIWEEPDGV